MLLANRCVGTCARMGGCPAYLGEFFDSFVDLVQWNAMYLCGPGEYVHYPRPPGVSIHDLARNAVVESARGDWVLMLDSDHAFDPDLCARLLNVSDATGADVVTGLYQYRRPPHSPVLFRYKEGRGMLPLGDWDRSVGAIEVDSAGAGCLFVRRRVYDRIDRELGEKPFDRVGGYGEDHSFFLRLHRLGIPAVCATRVECHHLQVRPLSLDHYDRDAVETAPAETARGYR